MSPNPIAIDINFDSLSEAFGFPADFRDPTYFQVADRFFDLSNSMGFKYTIFVIGKDLEHPEIFARVRDWARTGHEIGNHTWSHPVNLGALPDHQMSEEIERAHEIIFRCTGKQPCGFIAPAWSSGRSVICKLIDLGYLYDTSVFPSVWLYIVLAKIALNHLRNRERLCRVLQRRDWLWPILAPRTPVRVNRRFTIPKREEEGLVILPLPTQSRLLLPIWHTVGFLFGWSFARKQTAAMLRQLEYFYYLLHPADLVGCEDLRHLNQRFSHCLERMHAPLTGKLAAFASMLSVIRDSGRPVVTLEEMARRFLSQQANPAQRAAGVRQI